MAAFDRFEHVEQGDRGVTRIDVGGRLLEFRVLGPVTVLRDGGPVDLGGPQRRAVLTLLLVHANRVVPADTLADLLWGGSPPRSYRVQLQGVVSDLRRRLAGGGARAAAPIVTVAPGYLLQAPDDALDLLAFRAEVARAQATGDPDRWESAAAWWRGPAFGGFDYPGAQAVVAGVEEERWTAVEDLVDARLAAGRIDGLSAELARLTREHPLRERFHGQLMTVLARTSRVGEALAVYRSLRERLVDELGIEPSEPVRRLHRQILVAGADPIRPAEPGVAVATGWPGAAAAGREQGERLAAVSAYRQLPPDLADFVGRAPELAGILALGRVAGGGTTARIVVVAGMAGVGKTRLALRAAHQLVSEGRYTGGQLYLDLSNAVTPAAALSNLLRLLGVAPQLVPPDLEARTTLLRDRLADREALMILDSAADERQVEPLLATGAAGLVIVTSRRALAIDGALHINLSMFTPDEAATLVGAVIGADRSAAERPAVAALAALCGHLPLAVTVAAHRLRMRPAWSVAELADRLAVASGVELDELTAGSRAVEAVFRHAYEGLPPRLQLVFRRLGLHPGVDVTAASVAALADLDPPDAESALGDLLDLHLVAQAAPGRYHLHDLLRAFARRVSRRDETVDAAESAVTNLLDWYVAAVEEVNRPMRRFRLPVEVRVAPTKTPVPQPETQEQALDWLDGESANLFAVIQLAAGTARHAHAIALAHLMRGYLVRRAPVTERIAVLRVAEAAAREAGELSELAHTLTELGHAYGTLLLLDTEAELLRQAIELHELCGDGHGRAVALNHIGTAHRRAGRYTEAVEVYRGALGLFEADGDPVRIAATASNLSIVLHMLGRHEESIGQALYAIRVQQTVGGPGEAPLRTNLGRIFTRLGRHAEAVEHSARALELHRQDGSRTGEAIVLASLCVSYAELGRFVDAVRAGRRAVESGRRSANPEVEVGAVNSLGEAFLLAGRHRAAGRRFRRALAILGDRGDADERGRALQGLARCG